jgi:predicted enzyme related to lactoylglutathione lyase
MTARIDYVELPGGEIAASKRFYSAVFGWQFKDWGPDYADSADAGTGFGLNAGAEHRPAHPFPVVHVDDLEAALAAVRRAGGAVTKEIFSYPGGRRFHFRDVAGNELGCWSEKG